MYHVLKAVHRLQENLSFRKETLYNILIGIQVPMKLVRLNNMCFNETCSNVRVRKHFSDNFTTKPKGGYITNALQLCLEYSITEAQVNEVRLKLNVTYQLLFHDDVNLSTDHRGHEEKRGNRN